MSTVTLNQLTAEEKKQLLKELEAEHAQVSKRKQEERANYKKLASEAVNNIFPILKDVSESLADAKKFAYSELGTLITLKAELYNKSQEQFSHTFTNEDSSISITVGHRIVDGWDDTINTGIAKVNDFIARISENKTNDVKAIIDAMQRLLSKDAQGNLKASRVLELKKMADKFNDTELNDAIEIIEQAYKPKRTKRFVSCQFKNEDGQFVVLPLNIVDAEIATQK
ncbi:DUF3164 family protein [Pinibacter soli]|uniref:DUF3164 family protein n=1 Tax=Pinibacter soli TaxID=3044211 RepID=A0ABT6R9B5_9BACT|nr:DUF3164 family protein [Pinibacter soli]MDI3319152.1 DUF3164 family protein [Pinibacter soli]